MKRIFCAILSSFCMFGCSPEVSSNIEPRLITISDTATVQDVASAVSPAVVAINGISDSGESVGSGVCVASGGYVLTNSHVINGCDTIKLYLSDKSVTTASVIYEDTVLDLAILKSKKSLPYLNLSSSDNLSVGEDVIAVGTPLSLTLTHTFTKGIVSALNRTLKVGGSSGEGYMQNLIQHDASLNPGNSGGPLINLKGEVVGINTLKISSGEGIGFAIPTKSFTSLLGSYVKTINYSSSYLGVYGLDSEIAKFNNATDLDRGFYIIDIADNSPLKSLGVMSGSVITHFNGVEIGNTLDLKNELYKYSSDDSVELKIYQNGQYYTLTTPLEKVKK